MSKLDAALIAFEILLENRASSGSELEKALTLVDRIRTTISQHGEAALTDADYSALRKLVTFAKNLKLKIPLSSCWKMHCLLKNKLGRFNASAAPAGAIHTLHPTNRPVLMA